MVSQEYSEFQNLMQKGYYEEASRFAALSYMNGNPLNSFWLNRQAAALNKNKRHDRALNVAKEALSINPMDSYAVFSAAEALIGLNKPRDALLYLEEITGHDRLKKQAQRHIMRCLENLKDWPRMTHFTEVFNMPEDEKLFWQIKAFKGLGETDSAIAACISYLKHKPDNRKMLWELTNLEIEKNGLDSVIAKMARLSQIPSRPPIYKEIYASLLRRCGKTDLAITEYQQLTHGGHMPAIDRKQAFVLAKSGKEDKAIPIFEEILRNQPDDYYTHNAYAGALKRTGQHERGVQFYMELLEKYPEHKALYSRIKNLGNGFRK